MIESSWLSARRRAGSTFALTIAWLAAASPSRAAEGQKPPGLGYVYPPVVRAGETADVQLGGFDFTSDMEWFVEDRRIELEILGPPGDYHLPPPPYWIGQRASTAAMPIPREVPARIAVPPDQPEGFVRWQVANANGSSGTALFYVSRGTEIVESRSRDFPQRLPSLPVAVSGRLSRLTEVDRFELIAERDGLISVDLVARRLGAGFQGAIEVHDAVGRMVADVADTQGIDCCLTFAAKEGEKYVVSLHDVDFRGDRADVYRLAFTTGPRVVATNPAAGQIGSTTDIEFIGYGLATGQPVLESVRQLVTFPAELNDRSHVHRLQTAFGDVDVPIPLSNIVELTGAAIRPTFPSTDQRLTTPCAVTDRFPAEAVEHLYAWVTEKDEPWSIDVQARAIGSPLDVAVKVLGPDGKLIAENDDLPGTTDAHLDFSTTVAGIHVCVVRSMSAPIGASHELYRLEVRRQQSDFSLTVPQQINIPLGGQIDIPVQAARRGSFRGEIAIGVEGLPEGVAPDGEWKVPAEKSEAKLLLRCAADVAVVAREIRLIGTARDGETLLERVATAGAAGNLCPRSPFDQQTSRVLLAMTMPPPLDVLVVDRERQRDVHRGTTNRTELDIVRHSGFAGDVSIEMTAQQDRDRQGVRGLIIRVPPDASRVLYPTFMPEWLSTDLTRRIVVHAVAGVPDPKGNVRYLTKAGDARITMIMEGALLKLSSEGVEQDIAAGGSFDVPITLARSPELTMDVAIELVVPEELSGLMHAEALRLPATQDCGVLRIHTVEDRRLDGPWTLRLTATALEEGQWPIVAEASIPIHVTDR